MESLQSEREKYVSCSGTVPDIETNDLKNEAQTTNKIDRLFNVYAYKIILVPIACLFGFLRASYFFNVRGSSLCDDAPLFR